MDAQIEQLLCKRCGPVVTAALDFQRKQLAAKLARDKLVALGINLPGDTDSIDLDEVLVERSIEAHRSSKSKDKHQTAKLAVVVDPFQGRRNSRWRDVPIAQVISNIRGDVSPHELCGKLKVTPSVLRSRVQDIIGKPDSNKRWQKGIGYIVKGKAAWDHEQGKLRIDKTKGQAMAALGDAKASPTHKLVSAVEGRKTLKPGPSDSELGAYIAGTINVAKLAKKYKCGHSKIYRAIDYYKIRFGADAPHGEPKQAGNGAPSNGISKIHSNGAKQSPMLDMVGN
jgi:hypothetical protein